MIDSKFPNQRLLDQAEQIWLAGCRAVDAETLINDFLRVSPEGLHFGDWLIPHQDYRDILVVGAGKCSGEMAIALEKILSGGLPSDKNWRGQVQVPDDRAALAGGVGRIERVGVRPRAVNLPTGRVLAATNQLKQMLAATAAEDLIIALISGGGSALLELPRWPVQLPDLISVTQFLSQAGATIEQLNTVRRVLSEVKAGGLVRMANSRRWITLLVSDIWGDPLDLIASGPTCLGPAEEDSPSNLSDQACRAQKILEGYYPGTDSIPATVRQLLQELGNQGERTIVRSEKQAGIRSDAAGLPEVSHFVLGNNQRAVQGAAARGQQLGFACQAEFDWEIDGRSAPVEEIARRLGETIWEHWQQPDRLANPRWSALKIAGPDPSNEIPVSRSCLIAGGEPTVDLHSKGGPAGSRQPGGEPSEGFSEEFLGMGGRNQHLILLLLRDLIERVLRSGKGDCPAGDFCVVSAGTDGEDGNTPVAGAWFDAATIAARADQPSLKAICQHLELADSHSLLKNWGLLFNPRETAPPQPADLPADSASRIATNVCDLRVLLFADRPAAAAQ